MRFRAAFATFFLSASAPIIASDLFTPGDRVFVQARVIDCGSTIWNVEFGQVESSGEVVLFEEIRLKVSGINAAAVSEMLSDAVEEQMGRRPTSIRVKRVPKEDHKQATLLLMQVYEFQTRGCPRQVPGLQEPDWTDVSVIANSSHNKSLKADALKRAA
jgi:hypothetical protein